MKQNSHKSVYNSNDIKNSTLTHREIENILLEMEVIRKVSVHELFESKNLARVMEYVITKVLKELTKKILLFYQMLITNINDSIAGRFRKVHEYVRVGTHIAPAPKHYG